MVTISKELFVKSLTNIQKGLERSQTFDSAMEQFSDSYFMCNVGAEWLETAIELLCVAVNDKDDGYGTMIEWFLYEDVEKKVYFDPHTKYNDTDEELVVDLSTPELLYDYFAKYGDNDE